MPNVPVGKAHAPREQPPNPRLGRSLPESAGVPFAALVLAAGALGLVLIGMLIGTFDQIGELRDIDHDDWGAFWSATFAQYGYFLVAVGLLWSGAEGRRLSTGLRVGLVIAGVYVLVGGTGLLAAILGRNAF